MPLPHLGQVWLLPSSGQGHRGKNVIYRHIYGWSSCDQKACLFANLWQFSCIALL